MKLKYFSLSLLSALSLLLNSCRGDDPITPPQDLERTVLVYMIANNNLNSFAQLDINEMESAWDDSYNGKLYVFYNSLNNSNELLEISKDELENKISSRVVESFPNDAVASDPTFMRTVLDRVKQISPAKSYGMIMWSHGSGWLPIGSRNPLKSSTKSSEAVGSKLEVYLQGLQGDNPDKQRSFGDGSYNNNDDGVEMYEMANALKGANLEYLYFDACHMASIESLYQMRSISKYTIASTAETMAFGAPYHKIIPYLFGGEQETIQIAKEFHEYYSNQGGQMQTGTIAVIDNSRLLSVAAAMSNLSSEPITLVPYQQIQQYGRGSLGYSNIFYDLGDFAQKTWSSSPNLDAFKSALDQAVIYKAATPYILQEIPVHSFSGISLYIPRSEQSETFQKYSANYQWASDSGIEDLYYNFQ